MVKIYDDTNPIQTLTSTLQDKTYVQKIMQPAVFPKKIEGDAYLTQKNNGKYEWKSDTDTSQSLSDSNIFIGDINNTPKSKPVSGDISLANTGVVTINNDSITTVKLADGSVTATKLADGSVSTIKLVDGSVSAAKLSVNSITADKIVLGSVVTSKLADDSVTSSKIVNGSIVSAKISDGSIITSKISNGAISDIKLALNSVTSEKLIDGNVLTSKLADAAVSTAKLADSSVTTIKLNSSSVTTDKLADGSVSTLKIVNGAITTSKLGLSSVTTNILANNSVSTEKLIDGDVTVVKLADTGVVAGTYSGLTVNSKGLVTSAVSQTSITKGLASSADRSIPIFSGVDTDVVVASGVSVDANNNLLISSTVEAVDSDSGSLQTLGGMAVKKNIQCASTIYSAGNETFSDARLKSDIKKISDTNSLYQFYQYTLKADPTNKIQYGVIAQELQTIHPELVSENTNGVLSVDYRSLYILLINDLLKRVEKLEKKNI